MKKKFIIWGAIVLLVCFSIVIVLFFMRDKKKDVYIAGYFNFPPYVIIQGEDLSGFDIELLRYIAKDQGFEIKFRRIDFPDILQALAEGQIDICTAITIRNEREKLVSFTYPVNQTSIGIAINHANRDKIKSVKDLKGKKIGTDPGTPEELCRQLKIKGMLTSFKVFNDSAVLYKELAAGKLDVVVNDVPVNKFFARKYKNQINCINNILTKDYVGFPIKKGNDRLRKILNEGIRDAMDSGEYSILAKKFFYIASPEKKDR